MKLIQAWPNLPDFTKIQIPEGQANGSLGVFGAVILFTLCAFLVGGSVSMAFLIANRNWPERFWPFTIIFSLISAAAFFHYAWAPMHLRMISVWIAVGLLLAAMIFMAAIMLYAALCHFARTALIIVFVSSLAGLHLYWDIGFIKALIISAFVTAFFAWWIDLIWPDIL